MSSSVTSRAERDEILFGIIPQPAPEADVVDLNILCCVAAVAWPLIALERLGGELE
jgi:hypothetical protein